MLEVRPGDINLGAGAADHGARWGCGVTATGSVLNISACAECACRPRPPLIGTVAGAVRAGSAVILLQMLRSRGRARPSGLDHFRTRRSMRRRRR